MNKEKRNGIISLWKFIFACVIVLFHCNTFYESTPNYFVKGGYIAVEFFFIVSGFYMARKALKKQTKNIGKETIEYIWNLIKKLIPYLTITYVIVLITKIIFESHKIFEWINSIWNLLLLRQAGFSSILMNNQLWYLSSLIIGILILYPLLKKNKENFIYIVSPLIVILGLGYLNKNFGWSGLNQAYHKWDKIWYTGTIRSIIELNIGFIIYLINKNLKKVDYTKLGKIILTIICHSLLITVLLIIQFLDNSKNYDYIMLLFISIAIGIMASGKTLDFKMLSNKFVFYLEKLSMPMYINHVAIILILKNITTNINLLPQMNSIISLIVTIIFSSIETKALNSKWYTNIKIKIKKLIIKEKI